MMASIAKWVKPLKVNGFPDLPTPFSPVHRHLKFSAVSARLARDEYRTFRLHLQNPPSSYYVGVRGPIVLSISMTYKLEDHSAFFDPTDGNIKVDSTPLFHAKCISVVPHCKYTKDPKPLD